MYCTVPPGFGVKQIHLARHKWFYFGDLECDGRIAKLPYEFGLQEMASFTGL